MSAILVQSRHGAERKEQRYLLPEVVSGEENSWPKERCIKGGNELAAGEQVNAGKVLMRERHIAAGRLGQLKERI